MADQDGEEVLDYNEGEQGHEQLDAEAMEAEQAAEADGGADEQQQQQQGDGDAPQEQQPGEDSPPAAAAAAAAAADGGGGQEGGGAQQEPAKELHAGGSASDPMSQPPHGTEIYIANIAMDAREEQVRAFVEAMGEVFQLRLPKNPDGRNRGYGFVVYTTRAAAENAVQHLNATELPDHPGRKVRVSESQVRNRLFMGNLPRGMTTHQLEEELRREVVGLEAVELLLDKENPELNRGFGFATFYNYAAADAARRKYSDLERTIGGRPVTVTWAEPKKEEDTSKVKALYVGGLPESVTEDKLRELFSAYGEVERVMLPYSKEAPGRYREYGFVHFKERAGALAAAARCDEAAPTLDGKALAVQMAKPQHNDHPGPGGYGGGPGRGRGDFFGPRDYGGRGRGGYGGRGGYAGGRGGYDRHYDYDDGGYDDYEDDGYGGGGGYGGGYAAAAAPVAAAGSVMMPVQLPTGQIGYMLVPAGAAAAVAGAGGPLRRSVAAAGYGGGGGGYGGGGGGYGWGGYGGGGRAPGGYPPRGRPHPY